MAPGLDLPTGTVTFLFTDIEGSTRLLQELGAGYREVQDQHSEIVRKAIAEGEGVEIRTEGDSFFAVFPSAGGALRAAVAAQRGMAAHPWSNGSPLRVRMGMHTGEGVLGGDDYLGIDVNRAARIAAAGHGGQILVSDATRALVEHALPDGALLRDLGKHRLKDIAHPEHLHDVVIEGLLGEFPPLRTSDVPWNVPSDRSRFIGRGAEIRAVVDLLSRSRLVTLTGSGGSGKTRLATRVAAEMRDAFADGVVFVDLAPLSDPALIPSSIAGATGVREEIERPLAETLRRELRPLEMLLLLDNVEQVVEGADVLAGLLDDAPGLRVLATSRVPLRLRGEQEFAVPPLEIPDGTTSPERLQEVEAVALFCVRAREVESAFALTEDNARAVAELCSRLDGLPLAIELAASRVRVLSPAAILERLGERLHLLGGGPRDAPSRHQTLSEAIRWSEELLDDSARRMLRRLAVFAGGWTLAAADAVTNPDLELGDDTVDLLEICMEHGLIRRDGHRYRMLQTVRAYASERLGEERALIERRHAAFFAERVEAAERGGFAGDALAELGTDHDNLRAALGWARHHDLGLGLRMGAAAWRFWHLRGHLAEGRATLEELLAAPGVDASDLRGEKAAALVGFAGIVYWQNDFSTAGRAYDEAVKLARAAGADAPLGDALYGLGFLARIEEDRVRAARFLAEASRVFDRLGDTRRIAAGTMARAMGLVDEGDLDAAAAEARRALEMFVELGDLLGAQTCAGTLAQIHFEKGERDVATRMWLISLDHGERIGDDTGMAVALWALAVEAGHRGDYETALLLAGAGQALTEAIGGRAPAELVVREDVRRDAEHALGPESAERLWERGKILDRDAALMLAREKLAEA
jgi:predicted ATPase/class 3 adenylate cyclase